MRRIETETKETITVYGLSNRQGMCVGIFSAVLILVLVLAFYFEPPR